MAQRGGAAGGTQERGGALKEDVAPAPGRGAQDARSPRSSRSRPNRRRPARSSDHQADSGERRQERPAATTAVAGRAATRAARSSRPSRRTAGGKQGQTGTAGSQGEGGMTIEQRLAHDRAEDRPSATTVLTSSAPRVTNVNFDIKRRHGGAAHGAHRAAAGDADRDRADLARLTCISSSGDEIIVVEPGTLRDRGGARRVTNTQMQREREGGFGRLSFLSSRHARPRSPAGGPRCARAVRSV